MEQQTAQSATNEGFLIGEYLRQQRENLDLSLDYIATHTNIRVGQLRAIEEGKLNDLPGMTYAVGFVRAYADFMGLDSEEVAKLFKQEHTELPEKPDLHLPIPQDEIKLPDMRILAIAGFCALLVVIGFFVFDGDKKTVPEHVAIDVIEDVPEDIKIAQKEVEEKNKALVAKAQKEQETPKIIENKAVVEVEQIEEAEIVTKVQEVAEAMRNDDMIAIPDTAEQVIITPQTEDIMANSADDLNRAMIKKPRLKPVNVPKPEAVAKTSIVENTKDNQPVEGKIYGVEAKTEARVVLVATEVAWVQVRDANKETIFKKLLRPGDRYYVPAAEGTNLITTNAGGLDIIVDEQKAPSIGGHGEILRGLSLAPEELTRKRIRVRRNNR